MIGDDILADSFKFFLLQKNNVEKLLVAVNIIVQDPVCVCDVYSYSQNLRFAFILVAIQNGHLCPV